MLNSITLNSAVSPLPNFFPSSFSKWREGTKAKISSLKGTVAPLSTILEMVPVCTVPTANSASYLSQGLGVVCLCPNDNLCPSASNSSTTTSILSPEFTNSDGCLIFLVQERSVMWIRPSIPSSSSTNTPKLVKLRTVPVCLEPTGYFSVILIQGSGVSCLIPKDILRSLRSRVKITASTSSPSFTKSWAERKWVLQDISETWIRPSTPSAISTKAP